MNRRPSTLPTVAPGALRAPVVPSLPRRAYVRSGDTNIRATFAVARAFIALQSAVTNRKAQP